MAEPTAVLQRDMLLVYSCRVFCTAYLEPLGGPVTRRMAFHQVMGWGRGVVYLLWPEPGRR